MRMRLFALPLVLLAFNVSVQAAECPALLQGELPKLRSKEKIDLCEQFVGKPLVVVNTASFCGFTSQFEGLEALNQRYREQGLEILGVPSDSFKQESDDAEETARVCYVNYGVTFTMSETQPVTGDKAIPLFKELAAQTAAPRWNFFKYVVDRKGQVIARFSSMTKPDDADLIAAVEKAIASTP
ncbi:glutathione peroxidase [Pseudomonas daroniae]|uniref:Glutathione peroxidase n=1 Tax=Phytopseudomonas daroniae TaxID=2487519 RepID=A0A4Q9QP84_9GAMM|nr:MULTISPECIES: redoxin domain-containing protein [Pseudomonas]TBU82018.1 glutathione peroxidase [Pseudomonas daroniae]TBU84646.1 glutathione peroxidase [Pseudomonas sp. FRB 228]TBU92319.1 glutathione peroxidase [Pseudomonas daroniae]